MSHPLSDLLLYYYKSYPEQRSENPDLSNLDFNKRFGLYINGPVNWPYVESIASLTSLVRTLNQTHSIMIFYSSTDMYRKIAKEVDKVIDLSKVHYMSFSDVFYAIHRDQDGLVSIKNKVKNSDIIICAGASVAATEVITQIQGFSDCCLIMIG